jgi:hypothetical protein
VAVFLADDGTDQERLEEDLRRHGKVVERNTTMVRPGVQASRRPGIPADSEPAGPPPVDR